MAEIHMLDCTLRDGGYINQWKFGECTISGIIEKLVNSRIEIIECGYLNENAVFDNGSTLYNSLSKISEICCLYKEHKFACMINYGEFSLKNIRNKEFPQNLILRIAFHKNTLIKAIEYSQKLIEMGYCVFLQPMGVCNYSDTELLELIHMANSIMPKAFYIVDSFGSLEIKDFRRILAIADHNLNPEILLGYHSHDNKKQAYSNAQYMVSKMDDRTILIDATVFGMGRGAGNLNEELFAEYLNNRYKKNYNISALLEIVDMYINRIYLEKPWGYQLPYYLSAKHNCHPSYASYFSNKNSLTVASLDEIFERMTLDEKSTYSEEKAKIIYDRYQNRYVDDRKNKEKLAGVCKNRKLMLLGPGKSIKTHKGIIDSFVKENIPIVIALNFIPKEFEYTYVICTNKKRWDMVKNAEKTRIIVSSNICNEEDILIFNYETIKCERTEISDNVFIMLLNLLKQINVEEVFCAGIDGYGGTMTENYADFTMSLGANAQMRYEKNIIMADEISKLRKGIKINFITPSKYDVTREGDNK